MGSIMSCTGVRSLEGRKDILWIRRKSRNFARMTRGPVLEVQNNLYTHIKRGTSPYHLGDDDGLIGSGNNMPWTTEPPTYNDRYGFTDGAQTDIFIAAPPDPSSSSSSSSSVTTSGSSSAAGGTSSSGIPPSSTSQPSSAGSGKTLSSQLSGESWLWPSVSVTDQ
jgi:hypothetical protein